MTPHPSIATIGAPPACFNLAAYVLEAAQQNPDKVALRIVGDAQTDTWTYRRLCDAVIRTAGFLTAQGLTDGDRVLMRLGNTPDFPIVFLGAIYAGLVPIPTSTQLTVSEVTTIARETSPKIVIASDGVARPLHNVPIHDAATIANSTREAPIGPALGDPHRPAYIVYTSGTSGKPRAVVHAHRAIWARRMMWDGWYGLTKDDRVLHAGAFNWTYTLGTGLLDPWAIGATALIPASGTPADHLPQLLADHNVTIFAGAPGVYRRLLRAQIPFCPQLRHGLSAGEKLPRVTAETWTRKTGTPVCEAYGMSECSTFISTRPGRPSTGLGWPQPGRAVMLREQGATVPAGETGQIAIHKDDPGLMLGYLNAPTETQSRFEGDWFLTGDLGHTGPDGAIYYDGRIDDMMNAGGYRVSPIEVEDVLTSHPTISEAAVCETRISADTTVMTAFYVSSDVLDEAELTTFAAQSMAAYKVPRQFIRLPHLPRGANNKIQRQRLRRDWEAEHGQT